MAEVQLLGMTHYPPFGWRDDAMTGLMKMLLADPGIPDEARDVRNWPAAMQAEWGDDEGLSQAPKHRAALIDGLDAVRDEIEQFSPDLLLIFGDDQYENFREDLIPPYSILAFPDRTIRPYESKMGTMFASYWDEPHDYEVTVRGRPDVGRWLAGELLGNGIDVAYAYKPAHDPVLPHAFLNTVLFLDHRRCGFPWPIVCMPINCYGTRVVSQEGLFKPFGTELEPDPPAPAPWRLMQVGAQVARSLRSSPWRVSVIASSSWSHAFLTDHTWRLRPDTEADEALYEAMTRGDYDTWERTTSEQVEHAGQHEVLNWFALMGAARELAATPAWSNFVQTSVFNSNKVFAAWKPA
jgi:hypothetical protein